MPAPLALSPSAAFTIVAHNFLPRSRVLAQSFRRFHPEIPFFTVVIDHPVAVRLAQRDDPSVLAITDIDFGTEGFEDMATAYDVTEFATAVKPFAIRHLLGMANCVLYLDPDIEVHAALDPLIEATNRAGVSLTPHCLAPLPRDDNDPSETGILAAGVYNLGYVGVSRSGSQFVDWWAERLRRDALNDPQNFLHTDQKWVDLAVPIFRPHIEADPGYNVAYWNLEQRPITSGADGYLAAGSPLRFFHFSGYDPTKPYLISKYQPRGARVHLGDSPALQQLFDGYAQRLIAATGSGPNPGYGWRHAFPGLELTAAIRRAFHADLRRADREGTSPPPSPFRPGGAKAFLEWVSSVPADETRPLPRYVRGIWEARHDVRLRMPEAADGDTARLRTWTAHLGGAVERNIALLGWRPEADRRFGMVRSDGPTDTNGVNVVGYLTAELGVGEAGRLAVAALRAARVPVATVASHRTLNRRQHPFAVDALRAHRTVLMAINADQIGQIRADLGPEFFRGRHVIGQWFWELSTFPTSLSGSFAMVDELWAPTRFIADALTAVAPERVAVHHLPLPFIAPEPDTSVQRADIGLDDRFTFLFSFDMMSVLDRKNPYGLIEAYRAACTERDGARLVLKTMNGRSNSEGLGRLRWMVRDRSDITIIDEVYDQRAAATLMAHSDAYVSLHRSEGLGLTIAEALLLGKPVVATAYSGNVDFMDEQVAFPVRWTAVPVSKGAGPYSTSATWAEPDLDHAAAQIRRVMSEPDVARARGLAGQRRLIDEYSTERRGAAMRARLEQIWRC